MMPLDGRFDFEPAMTDTLAQQGAALLIDGEPIGSMGLYLVDASIGGAELRTSYADAPGIDGGIDLTVEDICGRALQGRRKSTFTLRTFAAAHERASRKIALGSYAGRSVDVLYRPLGLTMRGRLSIGAWSDESGWSDIEVTLSANPLMLGESRYYDVSPGDNAIEVGGNAPCPLRFELCADDEAEYRNELAIVVDKRIKFECKSLAILNQNVYTTIDSEKALMLQGSGEVLPTLSSDWPIVAPGKHVVNLSDGAVGNVLVVDRWRM